MLSAAMGTRCFIRANTKLLAVPLVPEIRLLSGRGVAADLAEDRGGAGAR